VKVVNQVIVGLGMCALAESAALTRAWGLPPETVVDALSGGRADSPLLREFFGKFATADPAPTGRVSNMVKDLETARTAAVESGVPLPVTTAAVEVFRWLAARGLGAADPAALMAFLDPSLADATHWTETPA
jgi:2-hydroxy-3-oxopropionate reductase